MNVCEHKIVKSLWNPEPFGQSQCFFFSCGEDYYKILSIPRDTNEAQIKKAFKKAFFKWHPDQNKKTQIKLK